MTTTVTQTLDVEAHEVLALRYALLDALHTAADNGSSPLSEALVSADRMPGAEEAVRALLDLAPVVGALGWDYSADHEGSGLRVADDYREAVARAVAAACADLRAYTRDCDLRGERHEPIHDAVIALAGRLGLDDGEAR